MNPQLKPMKEWNFMIFGGKINEYLMKKPFLYHQVIKTVIVYVYV